MARNPRQLPYQVTTDAVSGKNQRAAQGVFSSSIEDITYVIEQPYSEPLTLGLGGDEPQAIRADRILNLSSQTTPVLTSGFCNYTFANGTASITSIDGMSPGPTIYRFVFRVTYKAQN